MWDCRQSRAVLALSIFPSIHYISRRFFRNVNRLNESSCKLCTGTNLYVYLSSSYRSSVEGLCGNFDGDASNDLVDVSGRLLLKPSAFGAQWKVSGSCPESDPSADLDPCKVSMINRPMSNMYSLCRNKC